MGENGTEERVPAPPAAGAEDDLILRAKYLDFCSARLSEVFLSLTDERIYQLMEEAARESSLNPGALGFPAMMRLVTRKLQHSVPLPDFETWAAEYEADPERYDPLLLGLWKSALADREHATEGGDPASDAGDGE